MIEAAVIAALPEGSVSSISVKTTQDGLLPALDCPRIDTWI